MEKTKNFKDTTNVRRIAVEVAKNGFILTVESKDGEETLVFSSPRLALHAVRKLMTGKETET